MPMKIYLAAVAAALLLLLGCQQTSTAPSDADDGGIAITECVEPRPEICTMDYTPVCGQFGDGATKDYSNGCNACSDPTVVRYIPGLCGGS